MTPTIAGVMTPRKALTQRCHDRCSKKACPAIRTRHSHPQGDDHSRLAYTEALEDEKATSAVEFWHRAVAFLATHGVRDVRAALTDNGSCYRSRLWAAALVETGTQHKRTRPYTPRTNGKVERFNGTLAREWAYVRTYRSEQERRDALDEFLAYYNYERPHSALGGQPPASRVSPPPTEPSRWIGKWTVIP